MLHAYVVGRFGAVNDVWFLGGRNPLVKMEYQEKSMSEIEMNLKLENNQARSSKSQKFALSTYLPTILDSILTPYRGVVGKLYYLLSKYAGFEKFSRVGAMNHCFGKKDNYEWIVEDLSALLAEHVFSLSWKIGMENLKKKKNYE